MLDLNDGKIALFGYGREGQSTARYLREARRSRAQISVFDEQVIAEVGPGLINRTGPEALSELLSADLIVRSPGIPAAHPLLAAARQAGRRITSATNIFMERRLGTVVAVTGTKGKSTTSSLIAAALGTRFADVRLGGNIGRPLLDILEAARSDTIFVAELSSYQLEDIELAPDILVLLPIMPEHLNYHGGLEQYVAAKLRPLMLKPAPRKVYAHRSLLPHLPRAEGAILRSFGGEGEANSDAYWQGGGLYAARAGEPIVLLGSPRARLSGSGNLINMAAAAAVALDFGVQGSSILESFAEFSPLPHRLQDLGVHRGIRFINDSLCTVPHALAHALSAYGEHATTLIAGGFDRGVDLTGVGALICASRIRNLILFPTTGELIRQAVAEHDRDKAIRAHQVDNMQDAVRIAYECTEPGEVCLLSPASSSYSLFKNYEDRGEQFKMWVEKLAHERRGN